jgi:hypothetical protein
MLATSPFLRFLIATGAADKTDRGVHLCSTDDSSLFTIENGSRRLYLDLMVAK